MIITENLETTNTSEDIIEDNDCTNSKDETIQTVINNKKNDIDDNNNDNLKKQIVSAIVTSSKNTIDPNITIQTLQMVHMMCYGILNLIPIESYILNPYSRNIIKIANTPKYLANTFGDLMPKVEMENWNLYVKCFWVDSDTRYIRVVINNLSRTRKRVLLKDLDLGQFIISNLRIYDERLLAQGNPSKYTQMCLITKGIFLKIFIIFNINFLILIF